jgi:ankyrin repeat protein
MSDGNLNRKYGPFGLNVLHHAAGTCSLEKTRLLLDTGVEVNIKDDRGKTALMLAVAEGDEEMIRLLLFGIETTDKSVG